MILKKILSLKDALTYYWIFGLKKDIKLSNNIFKANSDEKIEIK